MRYFLAAMISICISVGTYAQSSYAHLSEYSIQVWTTEQGLPSNNLRQVIQDKRGFIWISTFNGLLRFDGHSFDLFNSDNLEDLKSNAFSVMAEDAFGKLYFGTQTSGLLKYDGTSFDQFQIENNFSKSISAIFIDSTGRVWVGAQDKGLYSYDKVLHEYKKVDDQQLKGATITSIAQMENGDIWFAARSQGLIVYNGKSFTKVPFSLPGQHQINCIKAYLGNKYIGTSRGVYILEDQQWRIVNGTEKFSINYMEFDEYGSLWVATETGLIRILKSGSVEYLHEEDGLPSRQISSLVLDDENNIWLSSKRSGLVLLRKSNFVNISTQNGLSNPFTNIIYQLKGGRILIGNDNGGVDLIKHNKVSPFPIKTDLTNVSIKDIIQDNKDNIWLATYKGILKIENGTEVLYSVDSGMPSNYFRCLFKDKSGNIWAGTKDAGMVKFSVDGTFEIIQKEDGLTDNYIFCIDQLPNGNIIAGTYQGGLNIIAMDGAINVLNVASDNSSPLIFNVEIINNQEYWLATDVGLFKYYNGKFFKIDKEAGLPVRTIFDVYLDDFGYLWLSSNLGMVRISKNSVDGYISDNNNRVVARLYDERDGMLSRECTGATKFNVTKTGNIWIPTSAGLSIIDPSNIHINEKIPPVYIKSITVDDELITSDGDIVMQQSSQRLVINYTALSYYSPAKINFKYRLKGFEKEWNEVGNQYRATYMNLPDGQFVFEVKASNNDGYWNEVPAAVNIKVEPYFYKSRLFILLISAFILIFAVVIYWIRIKVVEDKNRELQKLNTELDSFVYSVSHDLRAPLTSILGLINISKIDRDEANVKVYMEKIELSVTKLDDFIKEIISYSRNVRLKVEVESIDLKKMVEDTLEGLAYMNPNDDIKVIIEASENTILQSDKTRLQIIFNNIISNSFRYYKQYINNPYIKVTLKVNEDRALIIIEDNGIGIKPDRLKKIFDMFYRATETGNGSGLGLYIAKESVAKLEGTITVNSEFERGTTFTINIPNL